jgi:peptidoglycan/LPS O-acetylase OafA/YrhL
VAPCLANFGKHGDFSYGIYIIHFPLLQTMVSLGWFKGHAVTMLLVAAALLLTLAVLLWKFVEQPWLRRTSHYRSATQATAAA